MLPPSSGAAACEAAVVLVAGALVLSSVGRLPVKEDPDVLALVACMPPMLLGEDWRKWLVLAGKAVSRLPKNGVAM